MTLQRNGLDSVSKKGALSDRPWSSSTYLAGEERVSWYRRNVEAPAIYLYTTIVLHFILRQKPLPPSRNGRHIPFDLRPETPSIDERRGRPYISNTIRSSRYTIWDFLPKQFIFQATRLSNFYFICIGIPQAIPGFSTTGNYTTILPLTFFLILTIIKEGYDDYRRHRLDKVENNTLATALRPSHDWMYGHHSKGWLSRAQDLLRSCVSSLRVVLKRGKLDLMNEEDEDQDADFRWTKVKWHDIRVGDILKLKRNDPIPADVALLYASGEDGVAYVDTMALDGETSLKSKQALKPFRQCSNIEGLKAFSNGEIVAEDPNRDLYDFNGSVTVNDETMPITLNEVLVRGSVLRNTSLAIGKVVNTGEECKIRMNANHHPKAKKPRLERFTNQVVLTLIVYVIVLSVGCTGGYLIWHRNYEVHAFYLNNAYVPLKEIVIGYLIMFNNVIPLALYVSLEIVKIGQMLMIVGDRGMYDEASNTPMKCNTNTILENLGQVSYILSDKTGTLTENVMRFRGLSVAGTAWLHRDPDGSTTNEAKDIEAASPSDAGKSVDHSKSGNARPSGIVIEETEIGEASGSGSGSGSSRRDSDMSGRPILERRSTEISRREKRRLQTTDLLEYIEQNPNTEFAHKAREFILAVALCHTAIPERQEDGTMDFQASSPDELALVRAAQELGMLVSNRTSQSITLVNSDSNGNSDRETYEVLDVIEFSSKRKRMSIIVRCPDGKIWLLCKGADSAIIPRLEQASLAQRKSAEIRRSMQIERDIARKNEQYDNRTSFGGRPSLTLRRRSSMDVRQSMDIHPAPKRNTLEVPRKGYSDKPFRPSIDRRKSRDAKFAFLNNLAVSDEEFVFRSCFKHLDDFATEGLRTLLYAGKFVSESDYASWKELYQDATTALVNRQDRIEAAAETVEQGFDLLGASAIEDKLQQGVPETVDKLRRANIKIWMLTGDKRETAINIAHSAQICQPTSEIFTLDATNGDLEGQLRNLAEGLQGDLSHSVAVIDGQTLAELEKDLFSLNFFYSLITRIDSVICCRASPAQKASVVKAIRARESGLTMAIGDGANDIAMITASHVGIGIHGKEGLQAARVADFSIAQFRFLQRLILVHGRWNYDRTAKFILWTYWKEMFFYMVQALYQHEDGYTGSSLYENWSLTALNTLFTSLCVIVPGIFEQDLRAETLLAVPELYVYGQRNQGLNLYRYLRWMVLATAEGMLIWFLPYKLYGLGDVMGDNGAFAIGDLSFSLAMMWTNTKLLIIETHNKTLIVIISFIITTGGWWAWNAFLSFAYNTEISPFNVRGSFAYTFGPNPTWWAVLFVTWAILIAFEISGKYIRRWLLLGGRWPLWKKDAWRGKERRMASVTAEEVGVEIWQELERDPAVMERLAREEGLRDWEKEGSSVDESEEGGIQMVSLDLK